MTSTFQSKDWFDLSDFDSRSSRSSSFSTAIPPTITQTHFEPLTNTKTVTKLHTSPLTTHTIRTTTKFRVSPSRVSAERIALHATFSKFGDEKGKSSGEVDEATTRWGDDVPFWLGEEWREEEERRRMGGAVAGVEGEMLKGTVVCRICSGDHYTMHCAYPPATLDVEPLPSAPTSPATTKYIPPSRRPLGTTPASSSPTTGDDKLTCLRVSCISDTITDDELYARFVRFGRIARTFLPRNYETGEGKGYGYVSFVRRKDAVRAMEMMDRKGFDNLIMRVAWDERNFASNSSVKWSHRGKS